MYLDFPDAPNVGDLFEPPGGLRWKWDGEAWRLETTVIEGPEGPPGPPGPPGPGGGGLIVIASPQPPDDPEPNTIWIESDTGSTFIWYDDGDSQQWVQIGGSSATLFQPSTTGTGDIFVLQQQPTVNQPR